MPMWPILAAVNHGTGGHSVGSYPWFMGGSSRGGGWSHLDANELAAHLTPLLTDPTAYANASQACTNYMNINLGSTHIILNTIEK